VDHVGKPRYAVEVLEADSIFLVYKQRVILQNIYLRVCKGEITGLLGRNGSGKSSLIEVIYGIRKAQNSSVRLNGHYISKVFKRSNLVAYLPQKHFVPDQLKVEKAFELYQSDLAEALLYFPDLESLLSQSFSQLSGGQRRLVETAMVLASPASFVILDEPFSNLMPLHVESLKTWLFALKSRKGILITDHYYQDVLAISNDVYFLNMNGRTIHLQKPVQQLRDLGYIL
jgi:ABC-type multidrug transport system ATPase subunit